MELTALDVALAATAAAVAGRRRGLLPEGWGWWLLAAAAVLASQLALWLLKGAGEVVLYPWEYMFFYSPLLWGLYSAAKTLVVAAAGRERLLGLFLLSAVLAQPAASLINTATAPPLRAATISVCNTSLRAVVADTRLRMSCGYYCWPRAEAVAFTGRKPAKARITMLGVEEPLLLLVALPNGTIVYHRVLKPWHIYTIRIPRGAVVVETRETRIHVMQGCRLEMRR